MRTGKHRLQGFIAGLLVTLLLLPLGTALGNPNISVTEQISVIYRNIQIMVNGEQLTPRDAQGNIVEPFLFEGTTFLPARAISEALDMPVHWDSSTSTVYIGERWTVETLGDTIVAAGTFWEQWWDLSGPFASAHTSGANVPAHLLERGFSRLLPTSGFESMDDIRDYLLQYYTQAWVDAELLGEYAVFLAYNNNLFVQTARAGFARPDWETATHTLIEQDGNRAVVETRVLTSVWANESVEPWEEEHSFTFIHGKIDDGPGPWVQLS